MSEVNTQEVTEPVQEVTEEVEGAEAVAVEEKGKETKEDEIKEGLSVEDIVSGAKAKTPIGVQKRIDELTKEKYRALKEADEWKKKAESPNLSVPSPVSTDRPLPPAELEFDSTEEFKKARMKYEDDFALWSDNRRKITENEAKRKHEEEENTAKFAEKAKRVAEKYPDFYDSVSAPIFSPHINSAILSSDYAPEIGYYLAKNQAENDRLHSLDYITLGKEIGKLEAKFGEAKAKLVSSAPPPIVPLEGNDKVETDPSKMNITDWMAWNKKEELKKIQRKLGMGG